jgi:hypothetical protein
MVAASIHFDGVKGVRNCVHHVQLWVQKQTPQNHESHAGLWTDVKYCPELQLDWLKCQFKNFLGWVARLDWCQLAKTSNWSRKNKRISRASVKIKQPSIKMHSLLITYYNLDISLTDMLRDYVALLHSCCYIVFLPSFI